MRDHPSHPPSQRTETIELLSTMSQIHYVIPEYYTLTIFVGIDSILMRCIDHLQRVSIAADA